MPCCHRAIGQAAVSGEQDDQAARREPARPGHEPALRQATELFRATTGQMHAVALSRTGDRHAAEDLVQEVFQDAWKVWAQLADLAPARQRAWLFRVLANKVVDRFRDTQVRSEILTEPVDLDGLGESVDHAEQVVDRYLEAEVIDKCWQVIKLMAPRRQAVLSLWAGGLPSAAIAETLGMKTTTVRDHVSAGLAQLNQLLGGKYRIIDDQGDSDFESGRES